MLQILCPVLNRKPSMSVNIRPERVEYQFHNFNFIFLILHCVLYISCLSDADLIKTRHVSEGHSDMISYRALPIHLPFKDEVWCGACKSGCASNACRVAHAQAHPFIQPQIPFFPSLPSALCS